MTVERDEVVFIDEDYLRELVPMTSAVVAVDAALSDGSAPGANPPATSVLTAAGEVRVSPSANSRFVGVKLTTVAPGNPMMNLPKVQGMYLLLDARTLSPVALFDGAALTSLRTAAVSGAALNRLAPKQPLRVVVIGSGPQAYAQVESVRAVRPIAHITVVGRDRNRAQELAVWCADQGLPCELVAASEVRYDLEQAVRQADVVVTATSSDEPVFDSSWLSDEATVIAVGSREADRREVDTELLKRATVIVESRESALRRAGDIAVPIRDGEATADVIDGDVAELIKGLLWLKPGQPKLFTCVGEVWEDLVISSLAYDRMVSGLS